MSSDKRDITKLIRFNDREYQIVKENANACNMNFSAYVRYAILNIKMPNPDMRKHILKLINEVNHIGNNVIRLFAIITVVCIWTVTRQGLWNTCDY